MKKNIIKMLLAFAIMIAVPTAANAQLSNILSKVLGNDTTKTAATTTATAPASNSATGATSATSSLAGILGSITGSSSTGNAVSKVLGTLLGTSAVKQASLVGTWSYTQPCVAFESESVISNIGGSVASSKIQEKLQKGLTKAGIKPGKVALVFNSDSTFAITVGKRTTKGTYSVEGSDLTFTFNGGRSIKANVKLTLGTLQIAFKADKMLEIVSTIATKASAYSSQMGNIATLLGQYKGMYLGMEFNKTTNANQ